MRLLFRRTFALFASVVFGAGSTAAQAPPSVALEVIPFLSDVSRLESWSFFEPPADSVDGSYWLLGNRATLGVRITSPRLEVQGAFQYSQVFGLPRRATGPGPLGAGAMYYDAARTPVASQLYFKALSLRVKDMMPGLSATAGRMGYRSGLESPSVSPALDAIKRDRLDGLLVGEVEWSAFERAFDGVRVDVDRPRWHTTAAVLWPTQGGFEESANPTIDKVRVALGAVTIKLADGPERGPQSGTEGGTEGETEGGTLVPPGFLGIPSPRSHDLQLFTLHYRDTRDITLRPDNTGLETRSADVSVATIGASHVGVYPAGSGRADTLLWLAGQVGDWYGDDHRGFSVTTEGGYQWPSRWRPWVRAGLQYASGDDDPTDVRHGTFFPMLPSTRPDLFAGTFAQMNRLDVFAQIRLEPHARVWLRADIHRMSLANARDRWYSGTGATARRGTFFGYLGRRSSGARGLGTLLQVSAQAVVTKQWTVKGSIGIVKGGAVVRGLFAGDQLRVFSLESALSF